VTSLAQSVLISYSLKRLLNIFLIALAKLEYVTWLANSEAKY